jgi:hypothetical protein
LIIKFINNEIASIKKIKNNLKKFLYSEVVNGKLLYIDFNRIVSEIERMAVEIQYLEEKRLGYFKILEHREKKYSNKQEYEKEQKDQEQ